MRVVLGEDLTLLRDGLIRLLTAYDMDVVAAVDNGPELLTALVTHRPDVAVVDVRLPPSFTDEGLRAAIEARSQIPGLPVLVLSQHVEPLYARELLSTTRGGLGYLLKDRVSDVRRFIEAVRTVAGGGTAMDPDVVSQLLARHARDEPLSCLTPREREVLTLMAEGRTNAGIADTRPRDDVHARSRGDEARAMGTQDNEALVREAVDAYYRADTARLTELVHPDLEWTYLNPEDPDPQPQVCHGRDQLIRALGRQAGQGLASQVKDLVSAPSGQVVVVARTPGADQQRAWHNGDRNILVLTVRDGQIVAMRAFRDQAEANSFAGLA